MGKRSDWNWAENWAASCCLPSTAPCPPSAHLCSELPVAPCPAISSLEHWLTLRFLLYTSRSTGTHLLPFFSGVPTPHYSLTPSSKDTPQPSPSSRPSHVDDTSHASLLPAPSVPPMPWPLPPVLVNPPPFLLLVSDLRSPPQLRQPVCSSQFRQRKQGVPRLPHTVAVVSPRRLPQTPELVSPLVAAGWGDEPCLSQFIPTGPGIDGDSLESRIRGPGPDVPSAHRQVAPQHRSLVVVWPHSPTGLPPRVSHPRKGDRPGSPLSSMQKHGSREIMFLLGRKQ